jgi:hypothetical protein
MGYQRRFLSAVTGAGWEWLFLECTFAVERLLKVGYILAALGSSLNPTNVR